MAGHTSATQHLLLKWKGVHETGSTPLHNRDNELTDGPDCCCQGRPCCHFCRRRRLLGRDQVLPSYRVRVSGALLLLSPLLSLLRFNIIQEPTPIREIASDAPIAHY